jgi:hypothetical protein
MSARSLLATLLLTSLSGCVCIEHDPSDVEPLRARDLSADPSDWETSNVHFRKFTHNSAVLKEDPTSKLLGEATRVSTTVWTRAAAGATGNLGMAVAATAAGGAAAKDSQDSQASEWLLAHPPVSDEVPDWVLALAAEQLPFASISDREQPATGYALEGSLVHRTGLTWYTYLQFALTVGGSILVFPTTGRDFTIEFELKLIDLAQKRPVRAWRAKRRVRRTGHFTWFLAYGDEAMAEDLEHYRDWVRPLFERVGKDLRRQIAKAERRDTKRSSAGRRRR